MLGTSILQLAQCHEVGKHKSWDLNSGLAKVHSLSMLHVTCYMWNNTLAKKNTGHTVESGL